MRCYGYNKGTEAETPLELEEVTIQAGPDTLRAVARFLIYAAEQMELHGTKFGHEHFEDYCQRQADECRLIVSGK
jgi:hypothetical protein